MHRGLLVLTLVASVTAQEPLLRGVCFGPFRAGEAPGAHAPLLSALRQDIATANRVAARLRTYGMSGTGAWIPELCADAGVPCWIGAWISADRAANDLECELLTHVAMRFPQTVETVLVGNEVLLRGDLDEPALRRRIATVRGALRNAGHPTPVGTAEPWRVWLAHPGLANDVDVVVVHVHAYWDGVDVGLAARHTLDRLDAVRAIVERDDATVILGEFGWPTAGEPKGSAVPSAENAARYLKALLPELRARGEPYFAFEMWDEAWKANAEGSVGPNWGLFTADGAPKPALGQALPGLERGASTRPPRPTGSERR